MPNQTHLIFQVSQEKSFCKEVEETNLEEVVFVTNKRLEQIHLETSKDISLRTWMLLIMSGWPDDKLKTPLCVHEYWPYRDELTTQNRIVYRGTRIIIPASIRREMTARAHRSHLRIQYTTSSTRDIMYWPRMTADLTEAVQRCDICQHQRPVLTKEPLMTYLILNLPWQIVTSDCFECDGSHYLIVVDLYPDYTEIKQLNSLSSAPLIEQLKQIFAVHGIPITFISDNGPNYASVEFTDFTHDWHIQRVTSSRHHPKANG